MLVGNSIRSSRFSNNNVTDFKWKFIAIIAVSLATEAPTAEKIQGLVFGTATKEQKAATRASWDHWDIIHTVIILAITGAFYWYFW